MWLLLVFLGFLVTCECTPIEASDFYIAGVVEYSPPEKKNQFPTRYIFTNLDAYVGIIKSAKDMNVDILVFPEGTLNCFSSRKLLLEYAFVIPNPEEKIAPWEHDQYSEVFRKLSKMCYVAEMYVLINVIEKVPCGNEVNQCERTSQDNYTLFNTNIVMDRRGRVISKYQKYNLFEEIVDHPPYPQHAVFTTDFGVKFGHFICFDILFKEPAMELIRKENVSNILFPSMWFSELPHLSSTQFHQGWAYANNVNVLSSGANSPEVGSGGSGIFLGSKKIANILIYPYKTAKLLVSKVPKDIRSTNVDQLPEIRNQFSAATMENFKTVEHLFDTDTAIEISNRQINIICAGQDKICCSVNIKMMKNENNFGEISYKYKIATNYTIRKRGNRLIGEFYCSIVACSSDNPKSCGHRFKTLSELSKSVEFESVEITAKINYDEFDDLMGSPNSLDTSILPLSTSKYIFEENDQPRMKIKEYKIKSTEPLKDLLTFGIFGRNFALDDKVENNYV